MFSLNKNSTIVIYGAATSGKIIYDILRKNGIGITAFIDKRADELDELYGRPIIASVDDIDGLDKTECIVIIAIKNVFEHSKIADRLVKRGVNRIIYKPYAVLTGSGNDDEKSIAEYYDCLINNEIDKLSCIPETKEVITYACVDSAFIKEDDEWIWARVPVCMIYANNTRNKPSIWGDIPVLSMFPHIELFQEFLCDQSQDGIENYVEFCCEAAKNVGDINTTRRWKQNVVSNRLDVFCNMEMAYELDRDFFVRNAPRAEWNKAGYFNLLGGKHRCTFLAAKGDQYITLQISQKDYAKWVDHERVLELEEKLKNFFQNEKGRGIIEHPFFYKYPLVGGTFIQKAWIKICGFLSHYTYSERHNFAVDDMTALVTVDDMGYIARNLRRMGMKIYRRTEKVSLEEKIGEALGVTIDEYIDKEVMSKVDLAVVENEVYAEAKINFVMSNVPPEIETDQGYREILIEGYVFPGKKYFYIMLNE